MRLTPGDIITITSSRAFIRLLAIIALVLGIMSAVPAGAAPATGKVTGLVTTATGAPVKGVAVAIVSAYGGEPVAWARTGATGAFSVAVPQGFHAVCAAGDNATQFGGTPSAVDSTYIDPCRESTGYLGHAVQVEAGATEIQDLTLNTPSSIVGRAVDKAGAAVAGQVLRLVDVEGDDGNPEGALEASVTSGKDGRFSFAKIPSDTYRVCTGGAGTPYTDTCAPGVETAPTVLVDPAAKVTLDQVLLLKARITGTIRDTAGRPVADVLVTARDSLQFRDDQPLPISSGEGRTDADGRYSITLPFAGGDYCVVANDGETNAEDPAARPDDRYVPAVHGSPSLTQCPPYDAPEDELAAAFDVQAQPGQVASKVDVTLKAASAITEVHTPYFVGTPKVGHRLEGRPGAWEPGSPTVTYAWFDGSRKLGTGPAYEVTAAELGHRITVKATASERGYRSTTVAWTKADKVVKGTFWIKADPTVAGTPKVGRTLTAKPASSAPAGTRTYRWFRGSKAISKATKATYRIAGADRGKRLAVRVYYAQTGYDSTSRTSAKTATVK